MTEPAPERAMAQGRKAAVAPAGAPPGPVRCVLYRDGRRDQEVDGIGAAHRAVGGDPDLMVWISMTNPSREQLTEAAEAFHLHRLAVEDAVVAHQRAKAETYHDVLFTVLRPARYDATRESVQLGELHIFAGGNFAITIRHTEQIDFEAVRQRLEREPCLLAKGPLAVVYAFVDRVVDAYAPVVSDLRDDLDEVENQVFERDTDASRRIYRLIREVLSLQRAVDPLDEVLRDLMAALEDHGDGGPGPPWSHGDHAERTALRHHLRDVADHLTAVREHVDGFQALLQNIMAVDNTLVDQEQNEAMKKISSWGGILLLPALIASAYGMNIAPDPGFHWVFNWPLTLTVMALSSLALYVVFRRKGWL